MKKVRLLLTTSVIVFLIMICCSMSAFALTDGDWEFELSDNEVTITGYLGSGGDIIIPDMIYGCPVTKIEAEDNMLVKATSVVFPKNLKILPDVFSVGAYSGAENLEKIILQEGLEEIGFRAFEHCEKLREINIPSTVKKIDVQAFYDCKNLEKINLPSGLEEIGNLAFSESGLKEIDLSNINANFGEQIFQECKNLKAVRLSSAMTDVPKGTFSLCEALENVEFASNTSSIGEQAFYGCVSLEKVIFPSSLQKIEQYAFRNTGLKEAVIPCGVSSISSNAFAECNQLEALYIPDTVDKMYLNIIDDSPNAIVYCTAESYAAQYCKENGISYLTDNSVNSGIHVYYNGRRISFHSYGQNPEISDGRTLVPLRSIFEAMGADVEWNGATSTAVAKRGNVDVKITIGANEIYKNGKAVPVDVPAQLMNSRTMVPARVIAEAFGADVQWNGNGRTVLITE